MSTADLRGAVEATEEWFVDQGLPWFVDTRRDRAYAGLKPGPVVLLVVLAAACGLAAGIGAGVLASQNDRGTANDVSWGVFTALAVGAAVLFLYAVVALSAWPIVGWAFRRVLASLSLAFPLVTRALPLLLLFLTFLFINAEVWQVASSMSEPLLWVTVMLFCGLAIVFLLVRLPEEVADVERDVREQRLVDCCRSTPMEETSRALDDVAGVDAVRGMQRANLLVVLLVAQAVQVLLLSLAVFGFFLVFGKLAIGDGVVATWIGHSPHYLGDVRVISTELFQVSLFLAAFSALYFTVYAVTDQVYRDQFFTHVARDLERAVGVRTAYLAVRHQPES